MRFVPLRAPKAYNRWACCERPCGYGYGIGGIGGYGTAGTPISGLGEGGFGAAGVTPFGPGRGRGLLPGNLLPRGISGGGGPGGGGGGGGPSGGGRGQA